MSKLFLPRRIKQREREIEELRESFRKKFSKSKKSKDKKINLNIPIIDAYNVQYYMPDDEKIIDSLIEMNIDPDNVKVTSISLTINF